MSGKRRKGIKWGTIDCDLNGSLFALSARPI